MCTLTDMAREYRGQAARIQLKIRELEAAGAEQYRVNHLRELLRETRQTAHTLSHYYDAPRDEAITGAGFYARKGKEHDG